MEALGYIGEQLGSHVNQATAEAVEKVETPLFDASNLKLSADERVVYDSLDKDPKHLEQVIGDTELSPGIVSAGLISLRLKGLIKQLPGSMFVRG